MRRSVRSVSPSAIAESADRALASTQPGIVHEHARSRHVQIASTRSVAPEL